MSEDMKSLSDILRHPVLRNALALYGVQFAGFIIPLVTLPYLARILGPTTWGLVVFAQSFALWASLTLEYGFNLSATREIARQREDKEQIGHVAAGIMGAKAILFFGLVLVSLVVGRTVPSFHSHPEYLVWTTLSTIAMGFSPFWYFQGVERLTGAVTVELISRTISAVLLFWVVKSPADGWKVLALQAMSGWVSTGVTMVWVYREIPWLRPTWSSAAQSLRQGWSMFLFRGAESLYTTANAFILGLFVSPLAVGYFGGADRVTRAGLSLMVPISQALYPRMNHLMDRRPQEAAKLMRVSLYGMGALGTCAALGGWLLAPLIVRLLLGHGYEGAIPALRVLVLLLPLKAVSSVLGMQWMLPLGLERSMSRAILLAGLVDASLAVLLAPRFAQVGMAWAVVTAECCMMLILVLSLWRKAMLPGLTRKESI